MGDIRFRCPNCTGEAVLPDWMAGQEILCRYCSHKVLVPAKSLPDRRAAGKGGLYEVDEEPADTRRRGQRFYTPEYRCKICGTCIPVTAQEVGVRKFCPDCDTPFTVTQEWYENERRRRREEQIRSWTDPAIRLHPDRYPEMKSVSGTYDVAPQEASKPSELIRWPEPKKTIVTAPCKICGSILYIEKSQIGSDVRCPNCAASFPVTESWFAAERKRLKKRLDKKDSEKHSGKGRREPDLRSLEGHFPPAQDRRVPDLRGLEGNAPPVPPAGKTSGQEKRGTVPPDTQQRREMAPLNCKLCGALFYAPKTKIGKKMPCPECGTLHTITRELYARARRREEKRRIRLSYGGSPAGPAQTYTGVPSANSVPKSSAVPPEKKPIPVLCGLCGTLMYADPAQIGQQIQCPDCETFTTVTAPLYSTEVTEPDSSGVYRLGGDPPDPPQG